MASAPLSGGLGGVQGNLWRVGRSREIVVTDPVQAASAWC